MHYERALKLSPNDEDARKELDSGQPCNCRSNRGCAEAQILRGLESFRDMAAPGTLQNLLLLANALLALIVGFMYFSGGTVRDVLRLEVPC